MSNSYFRFKQFTVRQEKAAMKVCTDACLFGAWVADKIEQGSFSADNILDVGTGTGLLSLMVAQKSKAIFDAIEIDAEAAEQARENFIASPFNERLNLIEGDIKHQDLHMQYDIIMSNPPFFENDLKSLNTKRNYALHSEALSFEELMSVTINHLKDEGIFTVLLPYHRADAFIKAASKQRLHLVERVDVKQTENHPCFRTMLCCAKHAKPLTTAEIIIKEKGEYLSVFTSLLKDYYLYL